DVVHAALDDIAELLAEERLVDVVLVLADADRFRLDFDELGEWILETTRDRNRAANREVELREFFAREVGGGVHARTGFVDLHDERRLGAFPQASFAERLLHERFGLAAAGAVADRDRARRELP